jgi:hypothetical protein
VLLLQLHSQLHALLLSLENLPVLVFAARPDVSQSQKVPTYGVLLPFDARRGLPGLQIELHGRAPIRILTHPVHAVALGPGHGLGAHGHRVVLPDERRMPSEPCARPRALQPPNRCCTQAGLASSWAAQSGPPVPVG